MIVPLGSKLWIGVVVQRNTGLALVFSDSRGLVVHVQQTMEQKLKTRG